MLDFDIMIERPAAAVYALLDWSDPRNAKRQLGDEVLPSGDLPGRFRLTLRAMPDHLFDIAVTDVSHDRYGFNCEILPRVGRLAFSHELYTLEMIGDECCLLRLTHTATLTGEMSEEDFDFELLQLSVACHNALAKLKIHAEQGTGAVEAIGDRLIV